MALAVSGGSAALWHPEVLDTRTKIVDAACAPSQGALVTGFFDPVTVQHLRRLKQIRERCGIVTILLSDPPAPILEAHARAEVLAALDVVDYVVLPQERALSVDLFARKGDYSVFREEDADRARFQSLVDYIHQRHRAPAQR